MMDTTEELLRKIIEEYDKEDGYTVSHEMEATILEAKKHLKWED
jgi:hypothetical protein